MLGAHLSGSPWLLPSWGWWLLAIVFLFATAVRLQRQLDISEPERIKRLLIKNDLITFKRIAEIISDERDEYTRVDVLKQLARAVWRGEFESAGGFSKVRLPKVGGSFAFCDRRNFLRAAQQYGKINLEIPENWENMSFANQKQLFRQLSNLRTSDFPQYFFTGYISNAFIEGPDFRRWYRKFRAGVYEN